MPLKKQTPLFTQEEDFFHHQEALLLCFDIVRGIPTLMNLSRLISFPCHHHSKLCSIYIEDCLFLLVSKGEHTLVSYSSSKEKADWFQGILLLSCQSYLLVCLLRQAGHGVNGHSKWSQLIAVSVACGPSRIPIHPDTDFSREMLVSRLAAFLLELTFLLGSQCSQYQKTW